jgi:hypothetical protein
MNIWDALSSKAAADSLRDNKRVKCSVLTEILPDGTEIVTSKVNGKPDRITITKGPLQICFGYVDDIVLAEIEKMRQRKLAGR